MSRFFFMDPAPDDGEAMDKSDDAFRTISEVADELQLPQHVLRFWETRFTQIRPLKRGGGRRYYRPDDVELLRAIRQLLYSDGYTIRGVHRLLKEKGVRAVVSMVSVRGLDAGVAPQAGAAAQVEDEASFMVESFAMSAAPAGRGPLVAAPQEAPMARSTTEPALPASLPPVDDTAPAYAGASSACAAEMVARAQGGGMSPERQFSTLTSHDLRKLHAALFELSECRRILSAASA